MTAPDPLTITHLSMTATHSGTGEKHDASVRLDDLGTVEARRLRGAAADAEAGVESAGGEDLQEAPAQADAFDVLITISREGQADSTLDTTVSTDWEIGSGARQELVGYLSRYLDGATPDAQGPEQAVGPS